MIRYEADERCDEEDDGIDQEGDAETTKYSEITSKWWKQEKLK